MDFTCTAISCDISSSRNRIELDISGADVDHILKEFSRLTIGTVKADN